uniref:Rap-GAP domain-containing protein n=1 Tax=Paramoeba aestuarina TaxID=180227 RepID=A0A7S4KM75_9EUKA
MAGLFHTMETVTQVSNKIMQLTMVVQDKIYFIKKETKKKTAKRPGMMGGEQSAKHMEPKSPDSVSAPSLPTRDEALAKDWSVDEILFIWRNMLQIFGTVNSIRNPTIHVACLQQIWKVIQSVMWSESKVPYPETLDPDRPDFLCLIDIFGHLMFSACELPDAFVEGRAEAYKILCRMFCRDHIRPLPLKLLSHFYGIIQEGLMNRDSKNTVQDSIIINSSNIFNMALPGANTLIPYYLGEIRRILTGEGRSNRVKERAVIILTSLICLSSHLNGAEIPVPGDKKSSSSASSSKESNIHDFLRIAGASSGSSGARATATAVVHPFPFSGLLSEVLSIMTDALKLEMMDPEIKVRLIWGVCVSLFEIVFNQSAANLVVSGLVLMLLKHLSGQSKIVIRASVHAVTCLASVADKFSLIDPSILSTIIESVSANIVKEVSEYRSNKSYPIDESLVADQLYCLLEWMLVVGETTANDVKLIGKVSESLESALTGVVKTDSQGRKPGNKRKSERPGTLLTEVPFEEIYSQSINVTDPTAIALPMIREAAENVILHLLHFQHNVPGKEGIETLTSFVCHTDDIAEGEDAKSLHFVHNDSVLFSLVEIQKPDKSGRFSRLIMRDSIGKYAWDTDILFDFDSMQPQQALPFQFTEQKPPKEHLVLCPAPPPLPPATELDPELPPAHKNTYNEEVDQLDHLLHYLSHNYQDLLPESGLALHSPAVCMDSQKQLIEFTEAALVAQLEEDRLAMNKKQEDDPACHEWQFPYPSPQEPEGPYHHCRMILSHFGFLSYENFGGLSLLGGDNEKVLRSLNQLDLANGREMVKVGLIYLREGQEEQIEVLRNDSSSRSEMFGEFVRAIGWPIDVQTHRAYLGGLDPKLTTGVTAPYYATSTYELIYHDLTSMPTTDDPQQIHKKRHVGNDNVHIVWSEHLRDYNPRTIVSEFNDAHIVIYPLPNGLYKIHVFQKENVELFGPLMHGMCVSKQLLPSLVRSTCLMANKYVRYTHEGYVTPFAARKRVLNQIVERHKTEATYRELIGSIVP